MSSRESEPGPEASDPGGVVWVFRRGRRERLADVQNRRDATEFFYGMISLADRYGTAFVEDDSGNRLLRWLWWPFERVISRRLRLGCALPLALDHLGTLRRARVIVATTDACGLPVALLKSLGILEARVVYLSQGLSDRLRAYGRGRWLSRRIRALLTTEVDRLVVLGPWAQRALSESLQVKPECVSVVPFGVDTLFWHATTEEASSGEILSVGSDAGRDYPTLLEASAGLPLHIVSRRRIPIERYPGARQSTSHDAVELRRLYRESRFVVIPLQDLDQPSGQSSVLQAIGCGKAVIVTRTRGWWGGDRLENDVHCLLVPPGDVGALRAAIHRLWTDPLLAEEIGRRARIAVVEHFREADMAAAMGEIIASCLEGDRRF